jgi:hypothetical protein
LFNLDTVLARLADLLGTSAIDADVHIEFEVINLPLTFCIVSALCCLFNGSLLEPRSFTLVLPAVRGIPFVWVVIDLPLGTVRTGLGWMPSVQLLRRQVPIIRFFIRLSVTVQN